MYSLTAPTEDFIKVERTTLAADAAAGSDVSLTLENNNGLAENEFIVIGHEGSELAELEQINAAVSGNTSVQVATLKFNHKKGEPVTKYRYNKRKFYGCATENGTFVELTADGSPKDIQVDDPQGTTIEYTGADGYVYFKATYYNSQDTTETDIADAVAVLANNSLRYTSIYSIRKMAGLDSNPFFSDIIVEEKRKQAENEVNSAIGFKYTLPLEEVPPLITQITTLLAAGYIDYIEFGAEGEGKKWLGEARALIKAIKNGTQLLIGTDSSELARSSNSERLSGYPDTTISSTADDARKFSVGDEY